MSGEDEQGRRRNGASRHARRPSGGMGHAKDTRVSDLVQTAQLIFAEQSVDHLTRLPVIAFQPGLLVLAPIEGIEFGVDPIRPVSASL